MKSKKVYLFIDGSNTYHRLKDNNLYDYFSFSWLFEELSKKFTIEKTFYYDAIKSIRLEPQQYSGQQSFHEKLKIQIPQITIRQRKLKYIKVNQRVESARKETGFCNSCEQKLDEFLKKSGLSKLSKEKGIDIMMVADMIKGAFQNKYDVAIVLTGDADFVPAVELVQLLGKEVVNLHCYAGSAGELRNKSDFHIQIDKDAKQKCFLKYF